MNAQICNFAISEDYQSPLQTLPAPPDLRKTVPTNKPATTGLFDATVTLTGLNLRCRVTLLEARQVNDALASGKPLAAAAAMTRNAHAFGIGHLLHTAISKGLISREDMSSDDIFDLVFRADTLSGQTTEINRHRFITWMKKLKIVAQNQNERRLKPAGTTPSIKALGQLITARSKISFDTITSSSRKREVVDARFELIWLMRTVCCHSLTMIGQNMGNRDHTTILNSINKVSLSIKSDAGLAEAMEILCEKADTIGVIQNRNLLLQAVKHLH